METRLENERLIRLDEVCSMVGYKKSKVYEMTAQGLFPPRIQLSPRTVVWQASAVQAWIAEQIARSEALREAGR